MNTVFTQGKDHKVAATQETITAQNSANQGNENLLFSVIKEDELFRTLRHYDFGLITPYYVIDNLKMAERFIDKARMPEDKKSVVRNSIVLLLGMIDAERKQPTSLFLKPKEVLAEAEEAARRYDNGEICEEEYKLIIGDLAYDCIEELNDRMRYFKETAELKPRDRVMSHEQYQEEFNRMKELYDFLDKVAKTDCNLCASIWLKLLGLAEDLECKL